MKNNTQGFTLIELLIVIAIIGILAAVLIPNLIGAQKRAYETGAQGCAKSIQTAMATLQIDKQTYDGLATKDKAGITALDGVSQNCKDSTMTIDSVTVTQNDYSVKVKDTRGVKSFTVTPSTMTANAS